MIGGKLKDDEIWKPIVGYEGRYEVSNKGRVRSLNFRNTGKFGIRRLFQDSNGYPILALYDGKSHKRERVHRLVARAFIPNPNNYPEINHKDENKSNNHVDNLEWCTSKYNTNYGTSIERRARKWSKPVIQYSLKMEKLNEFDSLTEALKFVGGKSISSITNSCQGLQKKAYGYIWKFKEDVD